MEIIHLDIWVYHKNYCYELFRVVRNSTNTTVSYRKQEAYKKLSGIQLVADAIEDNTDYTEFDESPEIPLGMYCVNIDQSDVLEILFNRDVILENQFNYELIVGSN